jgi:glucose dehydrogenase
MNYWESPDRSDRAHFFLAGGMLTAVNAQNGEIIPSFGKNGRVDLRIALYRQTTGRCRRATRADLREHDHHVAACAGRELRRHAGRSAGV